VNTILDDFTRANAILIARLEAAGDAEAARSPAEGAWSAAQVGVHVAKVTTTFSRLVAGDSKALAPAAPGFVERPWTEIVSMIPAKANAPERLHPPVGVTRGDAIEQLRASGVAMDAALRGLTAERAAAWTFTYPMVGAISLYQVGEWAAGHVKRHTAQAERALAV
jgi:hypothetical protein